jgi:heme exporter protein B
VIADALALARKDLLLELRRREVVLAMLQFVVTVLVIVHFALAGDRGAGAAAAAGMLWVAILFTALLGLGRAFTAEHEEDALDALLLAPVDRAAIWLGKVLAQLAFLLLMEAIALPAFWLFFFQENAPRALPVLAAVLLTDIGLCAVGVLVASLSQATRARDVMLPVLLLPVTIPLLLAAVTVSLQALDGGATAPGLGFLTLCDTVFALLSWGTYEYLVGE